MRDRRPVSVEPMATLDEKHLTDSAVFRAMHITGTLVVDDPPRAEDGSLDRQALIEVVTDATYREPFLRKRLRPSPLGLTTGSWVPVDDLDLAAHISFAADPLDVGDPASAREIAGPDIVVDPARPMWRIHVAELTDGAVALSLRLHHSAADGIFGSRVLTAMCQDDDVVRSPWAVRAPRNGLEQLGVMGRDWYRAQGSPRAAWREYWRKPIVKRVRRWGGRMLRPARNAAIDRRGGPQALLPSRDWRLQLLEFPAVRRAARARGLSVHDLLILATLQAVLELEPERESATILVPISRRSGIRGDMRNHISVTHVTLPRGLDAAASAASVRDQLAAATAGELTPPPPGGHAGYASFLPWQARGQRCAGGTVRQCVLWPATSPADRLAVFGSSTADAFSLAVTGVAGVDVDRLIEIVAEELGATAGAELQEAS